MVFRVMNLTLNKVTLNITFLVIIIMRRILKLFFIKQSKVLKRRIEFRT